MSTTDDRVRNALRTIARDAAAEVDTEQALALVMKGRRRVATGVWIGVAAAIAAGVVATVAWPDDRDHVVVDGLTSTAAAASTTGSAATPTTTVAPSTTQATTTAPTSVVPASDPLSPGVVEFTGIGPLRLDRPLTDFPGWPSSFDLGPSCGNLTPNDTSWDVAQARVTDDGNGRPPRRRRVHLRPALSHGGGDGRRFDHQRAAHDLRRSAAGGQARIPARRPAGHHRAALRGLRAAGLGLRR